MKNKIISFLLSHKVLPHSVTHSFISATYFFEGVPEEQELHQIEIVLQDGKSIRLHHAHEMVLIDLVKNELLNKGIIHEN